MLVAGKGLSDYQVIRGRTDWFQPEDSLKLHQESVAWLRDALGQCDRQKTVVVTHHAPSAKSIPPNHTGSLLNAAFVSPLDDLVKDSGVPLWTHGHTHYCVDYKLGKTRVFSNQMGYPGQTDPGFKPGAVIEV
jgi:Icc-related predicted phosphoesterase